MDEGGVVLLLAALLGTVVGAAFALLPGAHPYFLVGAAASQGGVALSVPPLGVAGFILGATTSWVLVSPLTILLLRAPDDVGACATECNLDAALSFSAGGLAGIVGVVLLAPGLREGMRLVQQALQPYFGFVLAGLVALVVLFEPVLGAARSSPSRGQLGALVARVGVAALTFCLSGGVGLLLAQRSLLPSGAAVFGLPIALVGLFAMPGLLGSPVRTSEVAVHPTVKPPSAPALLRGGAAGLAAGALVSVLPLSAGGVCGVLAKHVALTRDVHARCVSVGAARAAFYLFSLVALMAPGAALPEASPFSALAASLPAQGWQGYWLIVAAIAASGALAFTTSLAVGRLLVWRHSQRIGAAWALALLALAYALAGWQGALLLVASTAIGFLPRAFDDSPVSALGIALLPALLDELGLCSTLAERPGLS